MKNSRQVLIVAGPHVGQVIRPDSDWVELEMSGCAYLYRVHKMRHAARSGASWWVALPSSDMRDASLVALDYLMSDALLRGERT